MPTGTFRQVNSVRVNVWAAALGKVLELRGSLSWSWPRGATGSVVPSSCRGRAEGTEVTHLALSLECFQRGELLESGWRARVSGKGQRGTLGNFEQDSKWKSQALEGLAWSPCRREGGGREHQTQRPFFPPERRARPVRRVSDKNVASMTSISSLQTWRPRVRKCPICFSLNLLFDQIKDMLW